MKFTLTTSFYNGEPFVEQLYNNILSQTYKNWEWIVTDDFSSDKTKEILLSICNKDRRVKYVEQSFKKEMFWNPQNFCKDAEVIFQLDSDDLMAPKALEVYHHFFTTFPEVILINCYSNKFRENNWINFGGTQITLHPNLSSGNLTYLRAWRNKRSLNLDHNPGNWMKYFYNDLAIVCKLEEHGKVLTLPRMLYHYTVRPDSISNEHQKDVPDLRMENEILITGIRNRRNNDDLDTFERYFDPIHHITKGLLDYKLNNTSDCLKISFYNDKIKPYEKKLLRELFYDFDFNFNDFEVNSDYNIFFVDDENDLEFLKKNLYGICDTSLGKTQIITTDFHTKSDDFNNKLKSIVVEKYRYEYYISDYLIMNIIK